MKAPERHPEEVTWWQEEWLRRATDYADAPALVHGGDGRMVRYADLPALLAGRARSMTSAPEPGAVYLRRVDDPWETSLDLLAAAWGGATVLPLSARWPIGRLRDFLVPFGLKDSASLEQPDWSAIWRAPGTNLPPGSLLATSGSTGEPKLVHHRWTAHWANAAGAATILPLGPGAAWAVNLPLWHASGWAAVLRCLHGGAAAVLFSGSAPLHPHVPPITHRSLVATQLLRHLREGTPPDPALRAVLVGGGPVPGALREAALAAGWPLHVTYGMTETASQICTTPRLLAAWPEVSGPALPGREVRVKPDGTIEVRGPVLTTGYWHPGGGWDFPWEAEGWFATGDVGEWVEGAPGGWCIRGRRDRRFVCAGENIQPEKIEAVLLSLPGVQRVVVVPREDAEYGQRPVAFIDGTGRAAAWQEQARGELTGLELPVAWFRWPAEMEGQEKPALQFFGQVLARADREGYALAQHL